MLQSHVICSSNIFWNQANGRVLSEDLIHIEFRSWVFYMYLHICFICVFPWAHKKHLIYKVTEYTISVVAIHQSITTTCKNVTISFWHLSAVYCIANYLHVLALLLISAIFYVLGTDATPNGGKVDAQGGTNKNASNNTSKQQYIMHIQCILSTLSHCNFVLSMNITVWYK